MLYVTNESTVVSDEDVLTMTRACATQLRQHAAPLWNLTPVPVVFVSKNTVRDISAPGSVVIAVLDNSDQAGALGYHSENAGDVEYGRVFARPVLDNGGDALTARLSVASVLSHEVLEWFVDRHCNLWADTWAGYSVALEVGDPVESDSYAIPVLRRHDTAPTQVTVSNFVLPAWFDPQAKEGARLDWLGRTSKPFQMSPGGYLIKMADGKESAVYGETYPDWRKETKDSSLSRSARRFR